MFIEVTVILYEDEDNPKEYTQLVAISSIDTVRRSYENDDTVEQDEKEGCILIGDFERGELNIKESYGHIRSILPIVDFSLDPNKPKL